MSFLSSCLRPSDSIVYLSVEVDNLAFSQFWINVLLLFSSVMLSKRSFFKGVLWCV